MWGRTRYHSAVVFFPSCGCSRGRCRLDAAVIQRSAERVTACPRGAALPRPRLCPHPITAGKMCRAAGGRGALRGARPCQRVKACCPRAALRCPAQGGRQNSSLLAGCACTASPLLGCWGEWGGSSSPPESSIPIQ